VTGSWQQNNVDFSASLIIPVPSPLCGLLVVALTTITYLSGSGVIQTVEISPTQICSYCCIDGTAGTRYLLGDHRGQLMVVALHLQNEKVVSITTDLIGITSIAENISYLNHGIVFIGSTLGDSQLVKLHPTSESTVANGDGNLEILDIYPNIGPISDMCLVDSHSTGGQKQLVTCSGAYKDGSLRIIRSGIGIHEQVSFVFSFCCCLVTEFFFFLGIYLVSLCGFCCFLLLFAVFHFRFHFTYFSSLLGFFRNFRN
jgi:DNA damage-binding protein 1